MTEPALKSANRTRSRAGNSIPLGFLSNLSRTLKFAKILLLYFLAFLLATTAFLLWYFGQDEMYFPFTCWILHTLVFFFPQILCSPLSLKKLVVGNLEFSFFQIWVTTHESQEMHSALWETQCSCEEQTIGLKGDLDYTSHQSGWWQANER